MCVDLFDQIIVSYSLVDFWQVFEDRSNGVICYRDEGGEIICEGYDDEQPRIEQEIEKLPGEKSHRR